MTAHQKPSQHPTIHRRACAKINLALAVGPPLANGPDAGMHPIASWMHAIDLFDDLSLNPGTPGLDIRWADDALRPSAIDWPPEKDLAARAVKLLEQHTGRSLPTSLALVKRIPTGGGLGGGSSNAAAALLACTEAYALDLSTPELGKLSRALGSDVAFFLDADEGQPPPGNAMPRPAIVTGTGATIKRLGRTSASLVLIAPDFGCNTRAVYQAYDELGPARLPEDDVRRLAETCGGTLTRDTPLFNDLADAAEAIEPRLKELRQLCSNLLHRPIHITGSGSTMFVVADDPEHAGAMTARLRENVPQITALATRLA